MLRDGIRDDQWDRIKDLLPGRIGHVGATARNNRLFIDAVLYRIRTGIPWRDLPERFGDFKNIHRRFSRWAEKGLWTNLLSLLTEDADEEYVMIDSTLVRAHQHSSGAVGRNLVHPHSRCNGSALLVDLIATASRRFEDAMAQQVKSGTATHRALDCLQTADLPFHRTRTPGQR